MEEQSQNTNPAKERELETQIGLLKMEMHRKDEDLKIAQQMVEEERQKGGQERNQTEVERHKMQLDIEHWKNQNSQMERELMALKDILQYEKGAKMRLEDRVRDLESKSFGGGNGGGWGGNSSQRRGDPMDMNNNRSGNYGSHTNYQNNNQSYENQNKNQGQSAHDIYKNRFNRNHNPPQKKEEIVFGKPSFPPQDRNSRRSREYNKKRSNSPFAVNEKLDIYGKKNNQRNTYGTEGSEMNRNFGRGGPSNAGPLNSGPLNSGPYGDKRNDMSTRNQGSTNTGMMNSKLNDQWGSARRWGDNTSTTRQEPEDTGALDSIASKRMAVRRGRGNHFY
jgi:hypothetical protein